MNVKNKNFKEKYVPLSTATNYVPYSQEYLSLLARKRKIPAKKINGKWHAKITDVEKYYNKQPYISLKDVVRKSSYTYYDELNILVEDGHIPAKKIGETWHVLLPDVVSYYNETALRLK